MGLFRRSSAGVPARAVVVEYWQGRGTPDVSFESKTTSLRFRAIVRLVDGDGQTVEVSGRLTFWVGWSVVEGDTIPVLVDAQSGRPIDFDAPELERQMAPCLPLYKAESKRRSSIRYDLREAGISREEVRNAKESAKALRQLPRQWKDAVFDKPAPGGGLDASDPVLAPIEGVDFDTWVAVQAELVRERVPRNRYDEVAGRHGVPPGRWGDIESAWRGRMTGNPGLAQRFGEAYQAALR
jgi:hypothetical protein